MTSLDHWKLFVTLVDITEVGLRVPRKAATTELGVKTPSRGSCFTQGLGVVLRIVGGKL